jgi:hypothetical protein
MIIECFELEIVADDIVDASDGVAWEMREARVRADLPAMLEEVCENLTSMLPEGYSAQIGGEK